MSVENEDRKKIDEAFEEVSNMYGTELASYLFQGRSRALANAFAVLTKLVAIEHNLMLKTAFSGERTPKEMIERAGIQHAELPISPERLEVRAALDCMDKVILLLLKLPNDVI